MTLYTERFNSIKKAKRILSERLKESLTDKIEFSRKELYYLLKHYPEDYWVDKLERLYDSYVSKGREEVIENVNRTTI